MGLEVQIKKKLSNMTLEAELFVENGTAAVLGASGCGKSMTLKCIAGIERPDQGRIVLNGRVLFDSEKNIDLPPQKRKVGYLFQDYALFPHMTVLENICSGMCGQKRSERKKTAEDYAARFKLTGLEQSYPEELSGGQKQRTATARMLASKPDVILLDEPFSALDSYLRWEMEEEMKETLEKLHRPALFVSHDRDEVYRLCDTVSCIHQGKMEAAMPVKDFFHDPKTRTAARLSGCKNISAAKVLDPHHIKALDWNLEFAVRRTVPADITAVGIRAHNFTAASDKNSDNILPFLEYRVIEDPFEWNVSFITGQGAAPLQWKLAKTGNRADRENLFVPDKLYFDSDELLLLK